MLKKKRFILGGLIIVLALSYLGYTGFQSSATYYYTVTEFNALGDTVSGENVRVNGQVVDGSIEQDITERTLRFIIVDLEEEEDSLPIVYQGIPPDSFQAGREVVIEGYLMPSGVFKASNVLTKCPSKYEAEE